LLSIGEILKPELAEDNVEKPFRGGKRSGISLPPVYCCSLRSWQGAGHRKHARIEVHAHYLSASAHMWRGQARNYARAARHIEHSLASPERRQLNEKKRHGAKIAGTK
jgi:hypothetical protein